jgi:hypothetical protein
LNPLTNTYNVSDEGKVPWRKITPSKRLGKKKDCTWRGRRECSVLLDAQDHPEAVTFPHRPVEEIKLILKMSMTLSSLLYLPLY